MKKIVLILTFALLSSCSEKNETKTETKIIESPVAQNTAKPAVTPIATNTSASSGKMVTSAESGKNTLIIKPGETKDLKNGKWIDTKLKNNAVWSTSDNKILKVDKNGKVTALKEGTAIISVTSSDKKDKTKSSVTIQVNKTAVSANTANPDKSNIVIMETSMGTIKLKLFRKETPKTVENFTKLIAKGYYDKIIFHRVIDGFMIQGGDPQGLGTGGESIWGKPFADEFNDKLTFDKKGILAMANAGPNTNGSQFFITLAPTPHLNNHHTIFGEVIEGMDVVDAIGKVKTGANDKPETPVVMKKVRLG